MSDPLASISTRRTPQGQKADPAQEKNSAGGYAFVADDMTRLYRFLTIGTTGGTFYAGEKDHTIENAEIVLDLARTRAVEVVDLVRVISTSGRAPKQNPALFALAACAKLGDQAGRTAAYAAVPDVVRTGTHLFQFAKYVEQFGGWGNGYARAISRWYLGRTPDSLAYQMLKYRQREGSTHADLIRQAHPFRWARPANKAVDLEAVMTDNGGHRALFDWVLAKDSSGDKANDANPRAEIHRARHAARVSGKYREYLPPLVPAFEQVQAAEKVADVVKLIEDNRSLSWEMIPDRFINEPKVWEALLTQGVPQTALIRQLPRLTNIGLLKPLSKWAAKVAEQIADPERLAKGRVHPIAVLIAARTYASGVSARGDSTWTPSRPIVDALDKAFYAAYGAVEATGKRILFALDASASMTAPVAGAPLTCREAAAALMLVNAAVESQYEMVAFTADEWLRSNLIYDGTGNASARTRLASGDLNRHAALTPLAISPRQRLDDVLKTVQELPWAGTDCSLPMRYALKQGLEVDVFVQLTDNETWYGDIHPHQALEQYRRETGIDARMVVVSMAANAASIADPADRRTLDISGFDAKVPGLISDFARGI